MAYFEDKTIWKKKTAALLLSTQLEHDKFILQEQHHLLQGKATVCNEDLKVLYEDAVSYDFDLPEFGTVGGVHVHEVSGDVTVPSAMFVKCLDKLLDRLKESSVDIGKIVAISGDAQQCGGVYWKRGARSKLMNLDATQPMFDQLKDVFQIPDPPEWQNTMSAAQCHQLEEALGGPMELAKVTGTRAFQHCTGPQIMEIFQNKRQDYDNTERISLISSMCASLFLGDYAPIDYGDGSIMCLMDVQSKNWNTKCLDACGENLAERLGEPVPSHYIVGNVSSYLAKRYDFSPECKVVAFTGDNLDSLAGLGVQPNDLIITLGTGDGCFQYSPTAEPSIYGHILISSLDPDAYIILNVFKNASRARQRVMERCAGSWEKFGELFDSTPPGNDGNLGMYFDATEIVSNVKGRFFFDKNDERVDAFPPETEVRAVLESQFLARLLYTKKCSMNIGPDVRLVATGGASSNRTILQAMADIFNKPVYVIDEKNSAPLGGCFRAKLALKGELGAAALKGLIEPVCATKPTPGVEKMYDEMLRRYERLEAQVAKEYNSK